MKKLPRLLPGLGVLLLAGSLTQAQQPASSAPADDSLKGRVWTATARHIWADTRLRVPPPAPWPTNTAFTGWLSTASAKDNGGLGLLRGDVIKRLRGQAVPTPQLIQAILAEVRQPQQQWLKQVDAAALQADLQKLLPPAAPPPVAAVRTPAGTAPADTAAQRPAARSRPDSASEALAASVAARPAAPDSLLARYSGLAALLSFLLGVAAALGIRRVLRARRRAGRQSSRSSHSTVSAMSPSAEAAMTIARLRNEVQQQATRIEELEDKLRHYESARLANPTLLAAEPPAPAVAPAGSAAGGAAPGAAGPVLRYGPVQEVPFLEDRKIVEEPLPQLALQLQLSPDAPNRAAFTLSPYVNQSMLIGDGLNRLEQFFDYDPPVGRLSAVLAATPGTLQRLPGGWQVVQRGRLAVS